MSCAYKNCTNSKHAIPHVSFHRFPIKDKERCLEWVVRCDNPKLYDLSDAALQLRRVCSDHFEQSSFMNYKRNSLTKFAVPTLAPLKDEDTLTCEQTDPLTETCLNTSVENHAVKKGDPSTTRTSQQEQQFSMLGTWRAQYKGLKSFVCQVPHALSKGSFRLQTWWANDTDGAVYLAVFDDVEAWEGRLTAAEVKHLAAKEPVNVERYMKTMKQVLTTEGGMSGYSYSVEGNYFVWRKFVPDKGHLIAGRVPLIPSSVPLVAASMVDFLLGSLSGAHEKAQSLSETVAELRRQSDGLMLQIAELKEKLHMSLTNDTQKSREEEVKSSSTASLANIFDDDAEPDFDPVSSFSTADPADLLDVTEPDFDPISVKQEASKEAGEVECNQDSSASENECATLLVLKQDAGDGPHCDSWEPERTMFIVQSDEQDFGETIEEWDLNEYPRMKRRWKTKQPEAKRLCTT